MTTSVMTMGYIALYYIESQCLAGIGSHQLKKEESCPSFLFFNLYINYYIWGKMDTQISNNVMFSGTLSNTQHTTLYGHFDQRCYTTYRGCLWGFVSMHRIRIQVMDTTTR